MSDAALLALLNEAVTGNPPAADGQVEFIGPGSGRVDAVLGFFAHFVVAAPVAEEDARALLPDGDFLAPLGPRFLVWLADQLDTEPGSLDVVFARQGVADVPPIELVERPDWTDHPRVERALRYRSNCRVFTTPDDAGVLVIGRGLAGRWEMAFEVDERSRRRGFGRSLARAAASVVPEGESLFAQSAPGNVPSLRVLLTAGYQPIGSEVLFLRSEDRFPSI